MDDFPEPHMSIARHDRLYERCTRIYTQLRDDMIYGMLEDRAKHQITFRNSRMGVTTASEWFHDQIDPALADELLSILARLAKGQMDAEELNALRLQSQAIIAKLSAEYADLYADEIAATEET